MDLSIILCTYNPESETFIRVLDAIFSLEIPNGKEIEFIIVDNNSTEAIQDLIWEKYGNLDPRFNFRIIAEPNPGLLYARACGFNHSKGAIIVFFDDDNEPETNYLVEICALYSNFPNIGVAGPGNITVEYTGHVESWLEFYKGYFQEKKSEHLQFACYPDWMNFYPPGTGQTVRRFIYQSYLNQVAQGQYSAIGRTKLSMTSAEDVQLVFCAIKMVYAVASEPKLKLKHLIATKKTTIGYLKKLLFGMSSSYPEAYAECFPETRSVLPFYTNDKILLLIWSSFWKQIVIKKSPKAFIFNLSELLGKIYGSNMTRGENTNSLWFKLIPVLKLK